MRVVPIFGFDICCAPVPTIVSHSLSGKGVTAVNAFNAHSYREAMKNKQFYDALQASDVLIPDGSGAVLAAKILYGMNIGKVAGYDLFFESMKQLNQRGGRVYFLGSSQAVLHTIGQRCAVDFPNVSVGTLSPPFKASFDFNDIEAFIEAVNLFKPDILFVGLTAPKQEILIHQFKTHVEVSMISGIGAVFDFYAGTIKRPNPIWSRLHLEWLVRFLGEPRRLWKRSLISVPTFILQIVCQKFRGEGVK